MKKILIMTLCLMLFTPMLKVKAIADVEINSTNFPDVGFRNAVKNKFDKNKDGVLNVDEIRTAYKLDASNCKIKSVKGINYLTYLKELDLSYNQLTELDVYYNRRMERLHVENTELTKVSNISKLTKLETLTLSKKLLLSQNLENVKAKEIILIDEDDKYYVPFGGKYSLKSINSKWTLSRVSALDGLKISDGKYLEGFEEGFNEGTLRYKRKDGGTTKIILNYESVDAPQSFTGKRCTESYQPWDLYAKLSWDLVDVDFYSTDVYEIYRATSEKGTYKKIGTTVNDYYTDITAKPGITYYYRVRASVENEGRKIYTKFSGKQAVNLKLARNLVLSVDYEKYGYNLQWNIISGCDGYQLYRAETRTGKYKKVCTMKQRYFDEEYIDYTYSPLSYHYKIRAYVVVDGKNIYTPFSTPIKVYNF